MITRTTLRPLVTLSAVLPRAIALGEWLEREHDCLDALVGVSLSTPIWLNAARIGGSFTTSTDGYEFD